MGGDFCGSGLIIATASSTIDGAGIARIGDLITTHNPPPDVHAGARIVSGSFRTRVGGGRIARNGDYATCGHVISASNTTDDSSRHWAPQPPAAPAPDITEEPSSLVVEWMQDEAYPGHSGAILQWHGPGEGYDASRQIETGFVASGMFMETIDNLTPNVEYTVRVITTRRFAVDGVPGAEMTGTPGVGGGNDP